jgi:glutamate dehydrogenase/leucine dehydrogenase
LSKDTQTQVTSKGFNVELTIEAQEKKARKQRMADRKTKDKTKITNQDLWDLLMDIQAQLNEQ